MAGHPGPRCRWCALDDPAPYRFLAAQLAFPGDREGSAINYATVAKAAGVSRALLYRDTELREEINRLRDPARTIARRQPATERMSQGSRDELLATLRSEVRTLRNENQALRARLAVVLGKERAAAQQPQT
ncbi:DUF6262 family protein [Micrococcaceae bacterium Sec5.7]